MTEIVKMEMAVILIVKSKIYGHATNRFRHKTLRIIFRFVHFAVMEKEKETNNVMMVIILMEMDVRIVQLIKIGFVIISIQINVDFVVTVSRKLSSNVMFRSIPHRQVV